MGLHSGSKSGFGIVEVAVVLVIVSLMIGGIVTGRGILNNARLNAVNTQIAAYSQAIEAFETKYGGLPGDSATARTHLGAITFNGNGNGVVDAGMVANPDGVSVSEPYLFWQHLRHAGLIKDNFVLVNPTLTVVNPGVTGLELPRSELPGSVIQVSTVTGMGLVFEVTSYNTAGVAQRDVLKAEEAWKLDQRYDDGIPCTGRIRLNSNMDTCAAPGNVCIDSATGRYRTNNPTCRTALLVVSETSAQFAPTGETLSSSVGCGTVGAIRSQDICPPGYTGQVLDVCQKDGNFTRLRDACQPVNCGGGTYQQVRTVGCGVGTNRYEQVCNANGIWENRPPPNDPATKCAGMTASCSGSATQTLSCPIGQKGYIIQSCSSNAWTTVTNTCSNVTCGGSAFGSACTVTCLNGAVAGSNCPDSTGCIAGYSGTIRKVCNYPGDWQVTASSLVPVDMDSDTATNTACTTVGAVETINCPTGQTGKITRKCMAIGGDTFWRTTGHTCKTVQCGDQPVGAVRNSSKTCSAHYNDASYQGMLRERCDADGTWSLVTDSCIKPVCSAAAGGTAGNATWPTVAAGTSNVPGTCISGIGTPRRNCSAMGVWGTVTNPCPLYNCAATTTTVNGTAVSFPDAFNGNVLTAGCPNGLSGQVQATCNSNVWTFENQCVYSSCLAARQLGNTVGGRFRISPDGGAAFDAVCDMTTDGGGWMYIASSIANSGSDTSTPYNVTYAQITGTGIGTVANAGTGNYFMALNNIRRFTSVKPNVELWVFGKSGRPTDAWVNTQQHTNFTLAPNTNWTMDFKTRYVLNAGFNAGAHLTTIDRDLDSNPANCAAQYGSFWWYTACHNATMWSTARCDSHINRGGTAMNYGYNCRGPEPAGSYDKWYAALMMVRERAHYTSCLEARNHGHTTTGVYTIDPDGAGGDAPYSAFCDMTTGGGGWTLVGRFGANCGSFPDRGQFTGIDTGNCGYLSPAKVVKLANISTEVALNASTEGNYTANRVTSTNNRAINALRNGNNWHNGATWTGWNWTWTCTPAGAASWPAMFHACGNNNGPHWSWGEWQDVWTGGGTTRRFSSAWVR